MPQSENNAGSHLSQARADDLVRSFWVAYNNYGLYGARHPHTLKASVTLHEHLGEPLKATSPITFHLEHDAIVCEEWKAPPRSYGPRLVERLKDARIQSISFYRGIGQDAVRKLIDVLCNTRTCPGVDEMAAELHREQVTGLRFNFVTYEKVTIEESIVRRDLRKLAEAFSVNVPDSRAEAADADELLSHPSHVDAESSSSLALRLRTVRQALAKKETVGGDRALPSTDDMIQSLTTLRAAVTKQLQLDVSSGKIMEIDTAAVTEMERLTMEVVARIVREEYREGAISVKRLAEIIRRLVPDLRELKRILPRLKEVLLAEGMELPEYLGLVRELFEELQEDGIVEALRGAAEEIGISVDEVLDTMKAHPRESVRLALLASEVQSLLQDDPERFQSLLGDYIERLSTERSAHAREASADETGAESNDGTAYLEWELLEELRRLGVDDTVMKQVSLGLGRRRDARREAAAGTGDAGRTFVAPVEHLSRGESFAPGWEESCLAVSSLLAGKGLGEEQVRRFVRMTSETGGLLGSVDESLRNAVVNWMAEAGVTLKRSVDDGAGPDRVSATLLSLEAGLTAALRNSGIDEQIIAEIRSRVSRRLVDMMARFKSLGMLEGKEPENREPSDTDGALMVALEKEFGESASPGRLPLVRSLAGQGYDESRIREFVDLAAGIGEALGPEGQRPEELVRAYVGRTGMGIDIAGRLAGGDGSSRDVAEMCAEIIDEFVTDLRNRGVGEDEARRAGVAFSTRLADILERMHADGMLPGEGGEAEPGKALRGMAAMLREQTVAGRFASELRARMQSRGIAEPFAREFLHLASEIGNALPASAEGDYAEMLAGFAESVGSAQGGEGSAPGATAESRSLSDTMVSLERELQAYLGRTDAAPETVEQVTRRFTEGVAGLAQRLDREGILEEAADSDSSTGDALRGIAHVAGGEAADQGAPAAALEDALRAGGIDQSNIGAALKLLAEIGQAVPEERRELRFRVSAHVAEHAARLVQSSGTGDTTAAELQHQAVRLSETVRQSLEAMLRTAGASAETVSAASTKTVDLLKLCASVASARPDSSKTMRVDRPSRRPKSGKKTQRSFPREVLKGPHTKRELQRETARAVRYGSPLSCLLLSIDRVGERDDADDAVLERAYREIVRLLLPTLREVDLIGAWGGIATNLLVVILPSTDEQAVSVVENRVAETLAGVGIETDGGREAVYPRITTATFREGDGKSFVRTIKRRHGKAAG